MRVITTTVQIDGAPIIIKVKKIDKQRRFEIKIAKNLSEYVISDQTNELEFYEGMKLTPELFSHVKSVINQYFPRVRAIEKIGYDDYHDYNDY
ncbi:hypothetical protein [Chryseobacterium sp. 22543]|uniref:hypothetical protein n=1 Tax=Chryseobacterium sp. 22543 TaxID=3453940 RepID=UPI003F828169